MTKNIPRYLSKEEFLTLQNLLKNKKYRHPKFDQGNFVVIVDKADYLNKMENILNETQKFEKINLKNDGIWNFVNQEKRVDNIFKNLAASNSISEETRRSLKPVTYGLCKILKDIMNNCRLFDLFYQQLTFLPIN